MPDTTADQPCDTITISLSIVNTYELYPTEVTTVTDVVVPAPPDAADADAYDQWADDHIIQYTGTGRCDGDSWYDVTVTDCSDPRLIGAEFSFGY
ncbi:hypothetical protein AB0M20_01195 [Actinoplanes sp. NPDC051633]|uniref:hypothetical protein n=1 Tax=Actinoplanes sp. NPDC051633 TaxID=3155670 RepID=UPI0034241CFD